MNKKERNEMIIKLTKENKTNAEIIKELKTSGVDISERTIRRVLSENDSSRKFSIMSGVDIGGQNGFYITEEMWESLQDKIDSLLDTIDIQSAKIQSLEADIIKCQTISCNDIKSSKKYIVKSYPTKDVIDYCDENELIKYIKTFGDDLTKLIPSFDRTITTNSSMIFRKDGVEVFHSIEKRLESSDSSMNNLIENNNKLHQKINEII